MSALRSAQIHYDNLLPPPVSEDLAESEWLEASADQLLKGRRIEWGYKPDEKGAVTQDDFARAVQDRVNQRQIDGLDKKDALGRLVVRALGYGSFEVSSDLAAYLLGSKEVLREIAAELLSPHAEKAVAAQQANDELERECGF